MGSAVAHVSGKHASVSRKHASVSRRQASVSRKNTSVSMEQVRVSYLVDLLGVDDWQGRSRRYSTLACFIDTLVCFLDTLGVCCTFLTFLGSITGGSSSRGTICASKVIYIYTYMYISTYSYVYIYIHIDR